MIPVSFELKRLIAEFGVGWKPELQQWLPKAPIYITTLERETDLSAVSHADLMLPHDRMLIECVLPTGGEWSHFTTFVLQTDAGFVAYPFLRLRAGGRWTTAEVECDCDQASGECGWTAHPRCKRPDDQLRLLATSVIAVVFAIGDALARGDGAERKASVGHAERRKYARPGVTGWIYRVIDIEPALHRQRAAWGGTHASPCWHVRRGHWRNLPDGRRTFVRECEVGNPAMGGIVKDYRVVQEVA